MADPRAALALVLLALVLLGACGDGKDYRVDQKLKACKALHDERLRAHCIESVDR